MDKRYTVIAMSISETDAYDTLYFGRALIRPELDVQFCLGDAARAQALLRRRALGMLFVCSGSSTVQLEQLLDCLPLHDRLFVSAIVPDLDSYAAVRLMQRGVYCLPRGTSYLMPAGAMNDIAARFFQFVGQNSRQ